jgi:hypothetical protein
MGNYRYSLPEVTDSPNQGVKDKLDSKRGNAKNLIRQLEEEVAAGRATAEDVRAGQEIFLKTDELRAKQAQSVQDERDFLAKHPEFKPTKANWERMCLYLEGANVEANSGLATFEDMEAAFHHLKTLGTLELNKASVRQQEARAINDRNEARERAAAFNEEEAYTMPLNELARRARGW